MRLDVDLNSRVRHRRLNHSTFHDTENALERDDHNEQSFLAARDNLAYCEKGRGGRSFPREPRSPLIKLHDSKSGWGK